MSRGKYPESFSLDCSPPRGPWAAVSAEPAVDRLRDCRQGGIAALRGRSPSGALLVALLSAYSILIAARPALPRKTFRIGELVAAGRECIWELPLPLVVLGGIYTGYFAVSEAAAITAMYVFVVEVLILRDIRWATLPELIKQSMVLRGRGADHSGRRHGTDQLSHRCRNPHADAGFLPSAHRKPLVFLVVLNLFLLRWDAPWASSRRWWWWSPSSHRSPRPTQSTLSTSGSSSDQSGDRRLPPPPGHQPLHRRPAL